MYTAGLERAPTHLDDPTESFRHELDAYVSTSVLERLDVVATLDYGVDARGGGVSWWGAAGYLTGTAQRMAGPTGTLQVKHTVGPFQLLGWLEYRRDAADVPVFPTHATQLVLHQDTLTVACAAAF